MRVSANEFHIRSLVRFGTGPLQRTDGFLRDMFLPDQSGICHQFDRRFHCFDRLINGKLCPRRAEGLGLECKVGFMQRPERVVLTGLGALCCGIFAPMMENNEIFEPIMIFVIPLLIVAIFSNITAFARLNHCRKLLSSKDNE